ncbi:hypothetical protein AGMMS50268_23700 [Spirochaetia bacterium]|nr:hypothetical protein AGMMS49546_14690 [Spirochaetia bacterium]GHV91867.1 hypothetical protein AGMMS50268_23700 [Spirochaetia bacterium]
MPNRDALLREIDSLPSEYLQEIFDFVGYIKQKQLKAIPETMLFSETSLAKDWDTPEEDAAWEKL